MLSRNEQSGEEIQGRGSLATAVQVNNANQQVRRRLAVAPKPSRYQCGPHCKTWGPHGICLKPMDTVSVHPLRTHLQEE